MNTDAKNSIQLKLDPSQINVKSTCFQQVKNHGGYDYSLANHVGVVLLISSISLLILATLAAALVYGRILPLPSFLNVIIHRTKALNFSLGRYFFNLPSITVKSFDLALIGSTVIAIISAIVGKTLFSKKSICKTTFKGPHGGIYTTDFMGALNVNQLTTVSRVDFTLKDKIWQQVEKNYYNFLERMQAASNKKNDEYLIPKKIQLIWLGSEPTEEVLKVKKSWETFHPGWEVNLWNDKMAIPLIEEISKKFPNIGEAWSKAVKFAEKADILRYCILYKEGGTYVDADLPCYGLIDDIHCHSKMCVSLEKNDFNGLLLFGNAQISAVPHHFSIERALKNVKPYAGSKKWEDILIRTGPYMFMDQMYHGLGQDVKNNTHEMVILPPSYFYPLPAEKKELAVHATPENKEKIIQMMQPWTKGLHLWNSSWF